MVDPKLDDGKICMNKVVRKNLRVGLGDIISIKICDNCPNITKLHVLPIDDTMEGIQGDIIWTYLITYFRDAYRPIKKNDLFIVEGGFKAVEFKVVATEPGDFGIVRPTT